PKVYARILGRCEHQQYQRRRGHGGSVLCPKMDEREAMFQQMVREFPQSPMGHFSLGKYYLEARRFKESAGALSKAVALDEKYAAAWVALGDAHAGLGEKEKAVEAWRRALETPHGKRDASLRADLEQRMQELT